MTAMKPDTRIAKKGPKLVVPPKATGRTTGPTGHVAKALLALPVCEVRKDGSLVGKPFIEEDASRYQTVYNTVNYWQRKTREAGTPHRWTSRIVHPRGLCVWRVE